MHCQGSMHEAVLCRAEGLLWRQRTDFAIAARHKGAQQAVPCSTRTFKETTRQIRAAWDAEAQAWAALVCLKAAVYICQQCTEHSLAQSNLARGCCDGQHLQLVPVVCEVGT